MTLELHSAGHEQLDWVMSIERLPGYDKLVGRWDEARHVKALADPAIRYFLATLDGKPAGFTIVNGWNSTDHVTLIKRAAVSQPGQGIGRRMIAAVLAEIFTNTEAHRVCIGCFPDNLRARQAYEAAGFTPEGIARGSAYFTESTATN